MADRRPRRSTLARQRRSGLYEYQDNLWPVSRSSDIRTQPEPGERRFGVEQLDPAGLEQAVEELDDHPLGSHDDSELSLAGLQDKLLLVKLEDGNWGRPLHGRPSTHIVKADDPYRPGVVEAEAHCLALAKAIGLTTIDIELEQVGERNCLIVSRFDRSGGVDAVHRVHQEDLCQALAIDPDDNRRRAKYERAGGPGLKQAAQLLDSYSHDPLDQLDRLVAIATFTVLIGNADAHGKNLALVHPDPEHVELAPLYDTVPTVLWPKLDERLIDATLAFLHTRLATGDAERLSQLTPELVAILDRPRQLA